jgi:hypothetical protein
VVSSTWNSVNYVSIPRSIVPEQWVLWRKGWTTHPKGQRNTDLTLELRQFTRCFDLRDKDSRKDFLDKKKSCMRSLSLFSVAITEYLRLGNLYRKEVFSSQFWRLQVQIWQPTSSCGGLVPLQLIVEETEGAKLWQ